MSLAGTLHNPVRCFKSGMSVVAFGEDIFFKGTKKFMIKNYLATGWLMIPLFGCSPPFIF